MLRALGFAISTYHLNEGHAAFLALSLLLRYRREPVLAADESLTYAIAQVREQCVFTTHTPIEADMIASSTATFAVSWEISSSSSG